MKNPSFIALSVLLGGVFNLQAQNLVTNGDFQTGGNIFNGSPDGWNNTIPGDGTGTGQYDPGPTGNTVGYMETNTQMFQTLLDIKLQPNTTYTVTFDAQVSSGAGPFPAYLFTDVSYGLGSAGTSVFGGYIASADLRSGHDLQLCSTLKHSPDFYLHLHDETNHLSIDLRHRNLHAAVHRI